MKTVNVDLGERSYPIFIGADLFAKKGSLDAYLSSRQVMIVSNETIAPLYLDQIRQMISDDVQVDHVLLPDGEAYKNLDTLNAIFDGLLESRHNRKTTLIALGGGVVGDMTGFASACYQRGVNFIQIPTTLLSQVDSSVGGKTGVNHALGKNMIGAFHQPEAVLIDINVLNTLSDREFSAGMAEVIKYGFIADYEFLVWLEENIDKLMSRDPKALIHCIEVSCKTKAWVVSQDEKESGIRAILNLGHTFGHAIEADQGYGNWLHGEAVGAGMVMASEMSHRLGWIDLAAHHRVVALIKKANLPVLPPENMSIDDFLKYMAVDKKVLDGSLRLVLLRELGKAVIYDNVDMDALYLTLDNQKAL